MQLDLNASIFTTTNLVVFIMGCFLRSCCWKKIFCAKNCSKKHNPQKEGDIEQAKWQYVKCLSDTFGSNVSLTIRPFWAKPQTDFLSLKTSIFELIKPFHIFIWNMEFKLIPNTRRLLIPINRTTVSRSNRQNSCLCLFRRSFGTCKETI